MYAHLPALDVFTHILKLSDHARTLTELPDEYLGDIGPTIKKVALVTGAEQFNVLQVRIFILKRESL